LDLLAEHETVLGKYSVVLAEVAFNVMDSLIADARETIFALVRQIGKFRHLRRQLCQVHEPGQVPSSPGCLAEPTFYFEGRKASVNLKVYTRRQKLAAGTFGDDHVKLEWTLSRKPAIKRHLGGNKLAHLLTADLNAFLERNLRLERVNHVALGYVLRGLSPNRRPRGTQSPTAAKPPSLLEQYRDPDYRAWRTAHQVLLTLAFRDCEGEDDWEQAKWIWGSSAQIRGYLNGLRDPSRRRRRGRPKAPRLGVPKPITDYLIDQCFKRIPLTPSNYSAPSPNHP
jgi:hypothetical protein